MLSQWLFKNVKGFRYLNREILIRVMCNFLESMHPILLFLWLLISFTNRFNFRQLQYHGVMVQNCLSMMHLYNIVMLFNKQILIIDGILFRFLWGNRLNCSVINWCRKINILLPNNVILCQWTIQYIFNELNFLDPYSNNIALYKIDFNLLFKYFESSIVLIWLCFLSVWIQTFWQLLWHNLIVFDIWLLKFNRINLTIQIGFMSYFSRFILR